jgi:hypothetical protein
VLRICRIAIKNQEELIFRLRIDVRLIINSNHGRFVIGRISTLGRGFGSTLYSYYLFVEIVSINSKGNLG